jgi:abhydrolase domain-containing protein 6
MLRSIAWILLALGLQGAMAAASAQTSACKIATQSERIGTGTIVYNVAGSGPNVLLIHGLFASKEQWNTLACLLADAGYRAIAVDLPGYGKSKGFSLSDYRLDSQVDKLHALVTRLNIDRFDIAGNSMGGAIAALYASRHRRQVRSLAFIGSPLGIVTWDEPLRNAIYQGINPFIPVSEPQLDLELQLLFATPPSIQEPDKKQIVANYVLNNLHYVQVWNIVNLYGNVLAQRPPARTSTLIIWGDDDRVFNIAGAQRLHQRVPGSEVHQLPHAGHLLHMENASDVAPIYVEFLKNVVQGVANPASQHCLDKGGRLVLEKNAKGGEFGVCRFPDNLECEEWAMMRGDCRVGGIRVTGFVTPAARYCAITGGTYTVTSRANATGEQGTCGFASGRACDAAAYFDGTCTRESGPRAAAPGLASVPPAAVAKVIHALFVCDAGETVDAAFTTGTQGSVKLKLSDGRELTLPQALSASGARYANSNETFVFWNKGDTAFIEESGKTTYRDCAIKR